MHGGDIYSNKIKYDFSININPVKTPGKLKACYKKSYKVLSNYPDLLCRELRNALSEKYNIDKSKILCGNGASELLLAILRFLNPEKTALIAPCFTGYSVALSKISLNFQYFMPFSNGDFTVSWNLVDRIIDFLYKTKPSLLILTNPNNPTGQIYTKKMVDRILKICQDLNIFVLLDECFMDLCTEKEKESLTKDFSSYKNLIILKAFTKTFRLPGLRLAYCFLPQENFYNEISNNLPEWNVSSIAQKMGVEALKNLEYVKKSQKYIQKEALYFYKVLEKIDLEFTRTQACFILIKINKQIDLKSELLKKGILIRECKDYQGLNSFYYRFAVKNHRENRILLKVLKNILGAK